MTRQATILLLALVLWALVPGPTFLGGLVAYGVAWLGMNVLAASRVQLFAKSLSRPHAAVIAVLVAAVPVASLWSRRDELLEREGLVGSMENARDRARLEATPSLWPPVVFADHPQTFYVYAPAGRSVELSFHVDADAAQATALGHGLFRANYDPRLSGSPAELDGEIDARLRVDGRVSHRAVRVVVPRPHPRWLRPSVSRHLVATTSEETDEVVVLSDDGLVARIEVGDGPADCAFLDDRHLVVTHRYDGALWVIDVEGRRVVRRVPLSTHGHRVAAAPDGETVAVAVGGDTPGVFIVDAKVGAVRDFVPGDADWLAFGDEASTLVVTTRRAAEVERWRIDPAGVSKRRIPLGRPAVTLAVDGAMGRAMVATTDYRADGSTHLGNHFVEDQLLAIDLARLSVVEQTLTARRSSRQAAAGDVDRGVSPMGIDMHLGIVRVAFAGTNEVWRFEHGPRPHVVDLGGVVSAPHSVVAFASGAFAVTSPADGAIAIFDASDELRTLVRLAPDDDALLRESEAALARRMGERTFYEATRAGIACQSCHLHADTDHVMRNIGEQRLSPTLSVRGIAGTAPYLRDGSYPRIGDLTHLSETLFRGFIARVPGRAFGLEAYVESLPRTPSRGLFADRDLARERRGADAFVRAGCASCHAFPAFTNLGRHPVGALFPGADDLGDLLGPDAALDVPSLIGVARGGPFFTDGRADDHERAIRDRAGDGRHGNVAALGDGDIADLVHFLEWL